MTSREQLIIENNNARHFTRGSRISNHRKCVKIHHNNTFAHELIKFKLAYDLLKYGDSILSEAETKDKRSRVDLVDLTEGIAYEVAVSETKESLDDKEKRIPLPVERVRIPEELREAIKTIKEYNFF